MTAKNQVMSVHGIASIKVYSDTPGSPQSTAMVKRRILSTEEKQTAMEKLEILLDSRMGVETALSFIKKI